MPETIVEKLSPANHNHYRPDIDGLRCCAILPVVAYHAGVPGVSGGFVGVDIFFVISGFLITSLVRQQLLQNSFSLKEFFARRARRLFPALFSMMAISIALSWVLLLPAELEDFGESLATAAAFSSNILFWSEAGYFDGPSEFKPLLHTWSLAVEEHFYLLFPALLIALRKQSLLRVASLIGVALLISLALQMFYVNRSPDAAFFLSPNRFWELLIGALTAIFLERSSLPERIKPLGEILSIAGAACLLYSIFVFDESTIFPGTAALLPCVGTALLIVTGARSAPLVNQALTWRPMVGIGLISYSLYLWHWPVLVFLNHFTVQPPGNLETSVAIVGSGLLAWLSWRFIERPFHAPTASRRESQSSIVEKAKFTDQGRTLTVSGLLILSYIAFGLTLDQLDGVPNRLPENVAYLADFSNDKPKERKRCTGKSLQEIAELGLFTIGPKPITESTATSNTSPANFLVWGDSHAMVLIPAFAEIARDQDLIGLNATRNGCPPLLGAYRPAADPARECVAFNNAVLNTISSSPSIKTVVLIARWAIYVEGSRYKHESGKHLLLIDQESAVPSKSESIHAARRALGRTVDALGKLGVSVFIFSGVPEVGWDTPSVLAKSAWRGVPVSIAPSWEEHKQRQERSDVLLNALDSADATVLHPDSRLCQQTHCIIEKAGKPLYIDEDHLSSSGSELLRPLIRQALQPGTQDSYHNR